MNLYTKIKSLQKDVKLPSKKDLKDLLLKVNSVLEGEISFSENVIYRPQNKKKSPGGLLTFQDDIITIIVPDLHARVDFLPNLLDFKLNINDKQITVYNALEQGLVRIICLGDGLHSERRGKQRWLQAYDDYYYLENDKSEALEEEMAEGLITMAMVMECKCAFPYYFHFLKGNHENITNTSDHGNMPFSKFAYEGQMCYQFMKNYFGLQILASYSRFEKLLPVFVRGKNYLASHAEPAKEFSQKEIIDATIKTEVIYGLTWTKNNEAHEETVGKMISTFLEDESSFYFGGHRPVVNKKYNLRANGKFIQIHNPEEMNVAIIKPDKVFNPEEDIKSII